MDFCWRRIIFLAIVSSKRFWPSDRWLMLMTGDWCWWLVTKDWLLKTATTDDWCWWPMIDDRWLTLMAMMTDGPPDDWLVLMTDGDWWQWPMPMTYADDWWLMISWWLVTDVMTKTDVLVTDDLIRSSDHQFIKSSHHQQPSIIRSVISDGHHQRSPGHQSPVTGSSGLRPAVIRSSGPGHAWWPDDQSWWPDNGWTNLMWWTDDLITW